VRRRATKAAVRVTRVLRVKLTKSRKKVTMMS
jgi:hypothetical protein